MAREEKNEREDVRAAEESGALAVAEPEAVVVVVQCQQPVAIMVVQRCSAGEKRGAAQRH